MSALHWVVGAVALQRALELVHARNNEAALLRRGGVEAGARHYPLLVALHAGWLASLAVLVPADTAPEPGLLLAYAVLQPLRLWVVASLGPWWTTRIVTVRGAPLVRTGPYRVCRHPNYAVVAAEIAVLPLAFGAWTLAAAFTVLNALMLWWRVRIEDAALAGRRRT